MKNLFLITIVFLIHTQTMGQTVRIDTEVRMLALGDSYTIGESVEVHERWPHQLIDTLVNLGFAGDDPEYIATTGWTTQNLIQGIESMLDTGKSYNLVSLLIGVNNQYQGIPIQSYEPDLRKIVDLALGVVRGDTSRVLMLSIPDYAFTPFGGRNENISREIDNYNHIKRLVAAEYRIAFVDITPISRKGLIDPSLVAADGLHPSEVQYSKWVEAIITQVPFETIVHNSIPEQIPDDAITVYPNPAGSSVRIDSLEEISRISIFDSTGSIVSDQMINTLPVEIDLSHLAPGLYVIWLYPTGNDTVSRRTMLVHVDSGHAL